MAGICGSTGESTLYISTRRLFLRIFNFDEEHVEHVACRTEEKVSTLVRDHMDIPLSIDGELITDEYGGNMQLAKWAVQRIAQRRTCSMVMVPPVDAHGPPRRLRFGLSSGCSPRRRRSISSWGTPDGSRHCLPPSKKSHSPEEGMKLRAYLSDGQALWEDISTFLSCVKTRWLKANDVFPRGFIPEPPRPSVRGNSKSQEIVGTAPTLHLCRRRSPVQVQPAGGE